MTLLNCGETTLVERSICWSHWVHSQSLFTGQWINKLIQKDFSQLMPWCNLWQKVFLEKTNKHHSSLYYFVKKKEIFGTSGNFIHYLIYFVFLSSRLDEEAQKRADAESNLAAFRKVNTQLTGPWVLYWLQCPQARVTGQSKQLCSICNTSIIVSQ